MKIFQHIAANRRPENKEMVKIVEVGPRDGLQNETAHIPTEVKIAFVDNLSASGVGESGFRFADMSRRHSGAPMREKLPRKPRST
jgi:isopropylmalate/homocitrate/citramalate synthase